MSIDLSAALRRLKSDKRLDQIAVRRRSELASVADLATRSRPAMMLDTSVYIHNAAGRLPDDVAALVDRALLFHCSVCIGELAVGIANADPKHPDWNATRRHYERLMTQIPATRILVPDDETWLEAGLIAGTLARTQNFQPSQRKECLNDALIYRTAAKAGIPVLTSNRDEFDIIQQLVGTGHFIGY